MSGETDITQTIIDNAAGPASVANKTESATAHNPRDLVEVDKYIRQRAASDAAANAANPFGAMLFAQIELPGACR